MTITLERAGLPFPPEVPVSHGARDLIARCAVSTCHGPWDHGIDTLHGLVSHGARDLIPKVRLVYCRGT